MQTNRKSKNHVTKYLTQIVGNGVKNERSYTRKERIKDTKINNLQD